MSLYISINVVTSILLSFALIFKRSNIIFFLPAIFLIAFNILVFSHSSAQDHVVTMNSFSDDDVFFEPIFTFLTKFLFILMPEEYVLSCLFLLISLIAYFVLEKNVKAVLFVALILQFQTGMISVRIFLAIIIGTIAVFSANKVKNYFSAIIAPLIHSASIILLPIVILQRYKNVQSFFYFLGILFFIIIFIGNFNFQQLLVNFALLIGRDYSYYLSSDIGTDGNLSLFSFIKFLMPVFFIYICSNLKLNIYFFIGLLAFLLKFAFWEFEPLSRVTNTLLIIAMCYLSISKTNPKLSRSLLIIYCLGLNISLFFEERTSVTIALYNEGLEALF